MTARQRARVIRGGLVLAICAVLIATHPIVGSIIAAVILFCYGTAEVALHLYHRERKHLAGKDRKPLL